MNVLVDTSAWIALELEDDRHHRAARGAWEGLLPATRSLLVSTWILSETVTHLFRELGPARAFAWGRRLLDHPRVEWVHGDGGLASRALLLLNQRGDARFSFTDATSWVIAREYHVDAVFSFDRHLRMPGVQLIPAGGGTEVREPATRYRAEAPRRRRKRISSITVRHSASAL